MFELVLKKLLFSSSLVQTFLKIYFIHGFYYGMHCALDICDHYFSVIYPSPFFQTTLILYTPANEITSGGACRTI